MRNIHKTKWKFRIILHFLTSFHGHMKNEYPWPHWIPAQSTVFLMKKKWFWKRSLLTFFQQTGNLMGHKWLWGKTGFLQYYWFHAIAKQLINTLRTYKQVFNLHHTQSNPSALFSFDKAHVKAGDQSWALQVNSAPSKTSGVVQQGMAEV